jgi:hypothetical protein
LCIHFAADELAILQEYFMLNHRLLTGVFLLIGVLSVYVGSFVVARHLAIERQARECHFITAYFLAEEALREGDQADPKNIDDLIRSYGGLESGLLKPFVDSLVYNPRGETFTLEEPIARSVSLFRKDRLISTEQKWPQWESTGTLAQKFPEQKVPALRYK